MKLLKLRGFLFQRKIETTIFDYLLTHIIFPLATLLLLVNIVVVHFKGVR
jgi:hypothetical protein